MIKNISVLLLLTTSITLFCQNNRKNDLKKIFGWFKGSHIIVIAKKKFKLSVYNREGKVASYPIGIGSNPDMKAKLHEGDNRTPEGHYHITEIQSLDAPPESEAFQKITRMNKVYFFTKEGLHKYNQPQIDLGDNAYGPRFFRLNYPNKDDKKRYQAALQKGNIPEINGQTAGIGSGIAIHGNNDEPSIGHLCSRGCIRMYNNDVIELEKYITPLTPVLIYAQ